VIAHGVLVRIDLATSQFIESFSDEVFWQDGVVSFVNSISTATVA